MHTQMREQSTAQNTILQVLSPCASHPAEARVNIAACHFALYYETGYDRKSFETVTQDEPSECLVKSSRIRKRRTAKILKESTCACSDEGVCMSAFGGKRGMSSGVTITCSLRNTTGSDMCSGRIIGLVGPTMTTFHQNASLTSVWSALPFEWDVVFLGMCTRVTQCSLAE